MAQDIRKVAEVKTDTITTHEVQITLFARDMPDMSNLDQCFVEVYIIPTQSERKPIRKRIRLNHRDMDTLTSEFVVRDW